MKKLYHFKKINPGCLLLKTLFFKATLVVVSVWISAFACLSIYGQDAVTGAFQGTVIDKFTEKPIAGVSVKVINEDTKVEYKSFTDKNGNFFQGLLSPGLYTIQFKSPKYQSHQISRQALKVTASSFPLIFFLEPITETELTKGLTEIPLGNLAVASAPNAEIIVEEWVKNGKIYKNKILSNELLCVFDHLPAKKYKVSALLEGYKLTETYVDILANQTFPLTLNLVPNETSYQILSQVGKYYALVIGNNNYNHLPKLKTAETDARAVDSIIREKLGFETKLLLNATREQIIVALNEYRKLEANDNLIIYYAGHGFNDTEVEKAYWLPVDARKEDNANWISADDITINVKRLNARHVLIISDSCYSGTISRGSDLIKLGAKPTEREKYLLKMNEGKSRTLLASGGNEPVTDGGGGIYSVFAAALLTGFLEIEKDIFTAEEFYINHIKEKVLGKAEQTPEYNPLRNSGHENGDFVFIRKK